MAEHPTSIPWHRRPIPTGTVIAILEAVLYYATGLNMPWWFTCFILFLMWALFVIVAVRSEWTVNRSWLAKGTMCVLAAGFVWALGSTTVLKQYREAYPSLSVDGHTIPIPGLFHYYGGGQVGRCNVTIEGQMLMYWHDHYDLALVCGLNDDSIDRLRQTAIAVSGLYSIRPNDMALSVPYSKALLDGVEAAKAAIGIPKDYKWIFPAAYNIVLLPKNFDTSRIKSMADVPSYGGLIVEAEAATGQAE